jgi:hypothetical protein
VIACIEDPVVIEKILTHLHEKAASAEMGLLTASRAPPQAGLVDCLSKKSTLRLKWRLPQRKRQRIHWPEGRKWLEVDVKLETIQAKATEFSTFP